MIEFLSKKEIWGLILLIIIGFVLSILSKWFIKKVLLKEKDIHKVRKAKTYVNLFGRIAKIIIWLIIILMILQLYGFDVKTFVAGLGIVTVIVGLALQDTLKDILGGITILANDFYSIGDIITFEEFTGEVTDITLRVTKIKNFNNEIKCFTNRNVSSIINHTKHNYIYYLYFSASYETEVEKVEKAFSNIIKLIKEIPGVKTELVKYLGLDKLDESSINYGIQVASKYTDQFRIKKEINKIVEKEFKKNDIKIPYPQIEVHDAKII